MKLLLGLLPLLLGGGLALAPPPPGDPLRAAYLIGSTRPNCLQGQWQLDRGQPLAAIAVFERCVRRWDDLYSMVQLARLYQHGTAVSADPQRAAAWLAQAQAIDPRQTRYWQQHLNQLSTSP
ncbi:MAG TPA: hypothetical protein VJA19_02605 [Pseudomonas sp.]|nr:hypothetical protein [Pseudomonas sp.]